MYEYTSATYPYTQVHSCKTHTCRQAFLSGVSSCQVLLVHAHIKHSPRHSAHAATPSTFAAHRYTPDLVLLLFTPGNSNEWTLHWYISLTGIHSSFPLFVITQGCCNLCILKGKWMSGGEQELKLKFAPKLLVTKILICWRRGERKHWKGHVSELLCYTQTHCSLIMHQLCSVPYILITVWIHHTHKLGLLHYWAGPKTSS